MKSKTGSLLSESGRKHSPRVDLTTGSVHSHLIRMALPMMVGITASMGFVLADTFFIGKLGPAELAAMGFIGPITMIVVSASIGLSAGTSSVLARATGGRDQQKLVRLASNSYVFAILISLLFTIAGLLTIDPLFTLMGADAETMPMIRDYMEVWYWTPLFLIVPMVAMGIMRSLGDTAFQGKLMIYAALANVVLDPIMIFGLFGFPRMEMAGAALATLIARAATFIIITYYLAYRFEVLCFSREILSHFKDSYRKIMPVGIPAMATNMIIPLASGVVIAIIAVFGNDAVAGTNVALRIEAVTIIVFYALSAVIGPFVGQNLSTGKHDRIEKSLKLCGLFSLVWGAVLATLIALAAPYMSREFSDDIAIQNYTNLYLYIMPISYGAYGFVMTANATFNGIGKPLPGVIVSTLRVAVFQFPLVWLAAYYFHNMTYVFAASSLSNILVGVIAYIWVMRLTRRMAPSQG